MVVIPVKLEMRRHGEDGNDIRQCDAANVAEEVLVEPLPRRMARPQKDGLVPSAPAPKKGRYENGRLT